MFKFLKKHFPGTILIGLIAGLVVLVYWNYSNREQSFTVQYLRGASADPAANAIVNLVVSKMKANSKYRIILEGHSGTIGDHDANMDISRLRTKDIEERLVALGVDEGKITSYAIAGASPLQKEEGESSRSYQSRLARVVIKIYSESF